MAQLDHAKRFAAGLMDGNQPAPTGLHDFQSRPAGARYDVYRNNVMASLIDALEQIFPSVEKLVGRDFFRAMAREYIQHHPPKSRVVANYGTNFAAFLSAFPPVQSLPYLPDIARLERLWLDACNSADKNALKPDDFATIPQDKLGDIALKQHPAARLIKSDHAILSIFLSNRAQENADAKTKIDPSRAQSVLITRPVLDVTLYELKVGQFEFLTHLFAGKPLGIAAAEAQNSNEAFDLGAAFHLVMTSGAFSSFKENL